MGYYDLNIVVGSFVLKHIAYIITYFLTFASLYVTYNILKITMKSFSENTRPYITFNIESEEDSRFIFMIIRNNGIRSAENVSIKIDPPLKSYAFKASPNYKSISELTFSFIAPQQVIKTIFDHGLNRYADNKEEKNDRVNIRIKYQNKNHKFDDYYEVDMGYISHIMISHNNDVKQSMDLIHKDLEKLAYSISSIDSKLVRNGDKIIERENYE